MDSLHRKKLEELHNMYNRGLLSKLEFINAIIKEINISEEDYLNFFQDQTQESEKFQKIFKILVN